MLRAKAEKNEDLSSIHPKELVDFMVSRARDEPLAFCILLEMRFAEVIFLLHNAEKESRCDLFVASLKFLLPFFTSSHANKYVSMLSDFLVEWFCCSEAEQILFEKTVLTKKTKNGCNIFTDRFVEWMMEDMRKWLGKFATATHIHRVEQVALTLNDRKKAKCEGVRVRTPHSDEAGSPVKMIALNSIFCEVLVMCTDTNIWGPGAVKSGDQEENGGRPVEKKFLSLKGKKLNSELLFLVSSGTKVAERYWNHFLVDGNWNDPARPEKENGVPLERIKPTMAEMDETSNLHVDRVGFLDIGRIVGAYNARELKDELKFLNAELKKNDLEEVKKDNRVYKSYTKEALASCIVAARLKLDHLDREWMRKRKEDLWEANDMRRIFREGEFAQKSEAELENKFFSLEGTAPASDIEDTFNFELNGAAYEGAVARGATIIIQEDDEHDAPPVNSRISIGATKLMETYGGSFSWD